MSERGVTEALRRIADDVRVPDLPADLWRRGRRRQRRRVAAALTAATVLAALVVSPLVRDWPGSGQLAAAQSAPAVPSVVYGPLPGQRTVQEAPAGPAALIVSGEGTLRGSDVCGGGEGRTLVVGRDGRYRLVNGFFEGEVGQDFHLSPDGRYLAAAGPVDGSEEAAFDATSLVDLTTGRVTVHPEGPPVAWSPDGKSLLLRDARARTGLLLLDLAQGRARRLIKPNDWPDLGPYAAFSPDGARLAVQAGSDLFVVDVTSGAGSTFMLPAADRRLAGPAAWAPDGGIAVWTVTDGCAGGCDLPAAGTGMFRLVIVDSTSGEDLVVPDLDPVRGQFPRLLGWLSNGDAVVQVYEPAPPGPSGRSRLRVVALHPGGGTTTLVRLATDAHAVDVASDLLRAGHFHGDPPALGARLGDWLSGLAVPLGTAALLIAGLVAVNLRRRRRTR